MVGSAYDELARRLEAHLEHWLGAWPPGGRLDVVASQLRSEPGWDGAVRPVAGVGTVAGTVLSVPPGVLCAVGELAAAGGLALVAERIGDLVGAPGTELRRGVFRWCQQVSDLPDAGVWLPRDDPRVPEWLHPFNGDVLVALADDGTYAAGVGRKRHDGLGQELSVATEPEHRGRGIARRLVAQAARRVYDEGGVATYLHRADNATSAAVAEAAGFPDVGWSILGMPSAS
ncbi:MAG TPA: GNAT family N-acetyltransferase [Acidimicrobiales bacterium]|nr:GNAT family N-acetyltransferase [Acidimicrobiales bacterium]